MTDSGKMKPIIRNPLTSSSPIVFNEMILMHMEELGLPCEDTKKAIINAEHNQLSTTYALLEFQLEERLRLRRRSDFAGGLSGSLLPSPRVGSEACSPVYSSSPSESSPFGGSLRNSLRDSQQNCILA